MTPWYAAMVAPVSGEIAACASPRLGAGPAHVATSDACSMRKSAGCMVGSDANHSNALLFRPLSAGDGHVSGRHAQQVCQQFDQFGIRGALHGRCVEPDQQGTVPGAGDARPARTWNHPHINHNAAGSSDNPRAVLATAHGLCNITSSRRSLMPTPYETARLNLQLF